LGAFDVQQRLLPRGDRREHHHRLVTAMNRARIDVDVDLIQGESQMSRSTRAPRRGSRWVFLWFAALVGAAACSGQSPERSPLQGLDAGQPPPVVGAAAAGPMCGGVDVHTKHVNLNVGCATCHPCGAVFGFDVPFTFSLGTTTAGGTLTRGVAPAATTCSVACHSPMGAPLKVVAWNAGPRDCTDCHVTSTFPVAHPAIANPAPTGADCLGCHTTGSHTSGTVTLIGHATSWMDQASAGFHAFEANKGLGKCQGCHAADLSGGKTGFSCGQCHDVAAPVAVSWKVNCVMCHGGTGNQTGAPPKTTWGNSADAVRVGAHATHVTVSATGPALDCSVCHVKPADALAVGHIDGATATVSWNGMAVANGATPAWNRATATCANTYCHGKFPNGNVTNAPIWTSVGTGQAACGTCHGLPPGGTHPAVGTALTGCVTCHPATIDATGALIPLASGGKHLDGVIQVSGGGHPAAWIDTTSAGFHGYAAGAGIATCQSCHGVNLDGVGGSATTSCATCHGATWQTNCTLCHGGTANQTGAPPKGTWGYRADATRIGAHTKHVTAGAVSGAVACATCHVVPTSATSPGHLDGPSATVTFGGVAASGGATPSWNRATATCATTYCHGGYTGVFNYSFPDGTGNPAPASWTYTGPKAAPLWTAGPMTCSSCHGNPPAGGNWHSGLHGGGNGCNLCHPDVNAAGTAITNVALHINGTVEVQAAFKASCFGCH
jgi:predicted CxxxxCH...CXXCH cytochrome family protein